MSKPFVAHVVGGCVWDERLIVDALEAGESVPMESHTQLGGVARNVAAAIQSAQLDIDLVTHFIRGDDETGQAMDRKLKHLNLGSAKVVQGQATARYMSIENRMGKVLYGLADMDLFDHFPNLSNLEGDVLIADTNPSAVFFENLEVDMPLYVVASSPHKVLRAKTSMHKVEGLFLNKQEAVAMIGKNASFEDLAKSLAALGPSKVVITQGEEPPAVLEGPHFCFADKPEPLSESQSHNGLGDKLSGLTLAHFLAGNLSLRESVNSSLKLLGNTA